MPANAGIQGFSGLDTRLRGYDGQGHQMTPGMTCLVTATAIR